MRLIGLVFTLFFCTTVFAQENSPYSRYGLGNLVPNQNMISRAMGGISAGYVDIPFDSAKLQGSLSINSSNPATYGSFSATTFDIGAEADFNTLKSINPVKSYNSGNSLFSYMQLGFPIKMKKANKKEIFLGVTLGIKPISRINYSIITAGRLPGIDSTQTIYEGNGGLNQAFAGAGLRIKCISIGFNTGYMFGNKNYSTQMGIPNDSVFYNSTTYSTNTDFGSVFFEGGIMYQGKISPRTYLRIGARGSLKRTFKASEDLIRETSYYDASSGNTLKLDSVYEQNQKGNITYPSSYGLGVSLQRPHWTFGADFDAMNWKDYRYYGQTDQVQNNWTMHVGAEYYPLESDKIVSTKKYFDFVKYRMGFYYGPDYINVNENMPSYAFTFGAGFPLKLRRSYADENQVSILNTSFEIGSRGNQTSQLRENYFRVGVGLTLSAIWFQRSKYY